jgi:hypothetical protein
MRRRLTRTADALACIALIALVAIGLAGCKAKPQHYTAKVKITSLEVDQRDDKGQPLTVDVSVEFHECPGDQLKTFRGGRDFARCMAKHKVGDELEAQLDWGPIPDGYDFTMAQVGDCARLHDPDDESTHEIIQVCTDVEAHGVKIGFSCDRRPTKELLEKCPYFRTR